MKSHRAALCLALLVCASGCISYDEAQQTAEGYKNGLVVHAVASLDGAWLIPGKGLVLFGQVTPGIMESDLYGPQRRDFAAALSLKELQSGQAIQLPYHRFHAVDAARLNCVWKLDGRAVSVSNDAPAVRLASDPAGASPSQVSLAQQRIRIEPLPGVTTAPLDVALGPDGAKPEYAFLEPVGAFNDLVFGLASIPLVILDAMFNVAHAPPPKPVDPCVAFASRLFPRERATPAAAAAADGAAPAPVSSE